MQSGKRAEVRKSKIQKYRVQITKKSIKVQILTHVRLGRLEVFSLGGQVRSQKGKNTKYRSTV